jgi:flagellar P-ring protein precursor FlgI
MMNNLLNPNNSSGGSASLRECWRSIFSHFSGLFGVHSSLWASLNPKNCLATCLPIISRPNKLFGLKFIFNFGLVALLSVGCAQAERLKDLASIQGVRENQLIGYGLVVGLDGTGDQTVLTPFTVQSVTNMLLNNGVNMPASAIALMMLKNVAAVMVTATLPPFAQPGQLLDVTVSSMGTAKSLVGGTLLMAPLKGADGQVYAMAQGNLVVGGVGATANGSKAQINHLSVGRISSGATVERAVANSLGQDNIVRLELNDTDFATASRVVNAINQHFGTTIAAALNGREVQVHTPIGSNDRVTFLGALEGIEVDPALSVARVIMNARTGSVVMNQSVTLLPCAISHGNLTITINTEPSVSQPAPFSPGGQTTVTQASQINIQSQPGAVALLKGGASLSEVVKALNSIGATPQDLLSILQAMKSSGALRADLEII